MTDCRKLSYKVVANPIAFWRDNMNKQINKFFFLPLLIAEAIQNKVGRGVKGILTYLIVYLILSTILTILSNGINLWFIRVLIPSVIDTYLLLGMIYVFFFIWRNN